MILQCVDSDALLLFFRPALALTNPAPAIWEKAEIGTRALTQCLPCFSVCLPGKNTVTQSEYRRIIPNHKLAFKRLGLYFYLNFFLTFFMRRAAKDTVKHFLNFNSRFYTYVEKAFLL